MKFARKRLTYANVMSTIAVFLVVAGGSAPAANHLGKNTVGSKQLKKEAVTAAKIKNSAVSGGKIANGAITSSKLGGGSVGASNLGAGAVGTAALGDNAVTGSKLADGSVTGGKIGGGAVTGDKIAAGAVGSGSIANGAVTTEKIAASARSHAYEVFHEGTQNIEIPTGFLGNFATATALATLTVPSGSYFVVASTDFINSAIEPRSGICRLFEGPTEVGDGSAVI